MKILQNLAAMLGCVMLAVLFGVLAGVAVGATVLAAPFVIAWTLLSESLPRLRASTPR